MSQAAQSRSTNGAPCFAIFAVWWCMFFAFCLCMQIHHDLVRIADNIERCEVAK